MAYRMSSCGLGALIDSHLLASPAVNTGPKDPVGSTPPKTGTNTGPMSGTVTEPNEMINSFILPPSLGAPPSSVSVPATTGSPSVISTKAVPGVVSSGLAISSTSTPKSRTHPEPTGHANTSAEKTPSESELNGNTSLLVDGK